jgi:uncharacterized protein YgiM (DUF1202 family)
MSFATKVLVGLLSLGALITGALPGNARPATLITDTNLRTDPSLTATVSRVLSPGSNVEVLNITVANDGDYWYYVRSQVQGRAEGWVRGDLTSFEPSQKRYATLAGDRNDRINVRSKPRLDSNILHYGLPGDLVIVEESFQESQGYRWYRVQFPSNAIGWVREDLLSIWPDGCIITCPEM